MIDDLLRDRLVFHGGTDFSFYFGDTWSLSLTNPSPAWSPLTFTGPTPIARSDHKAIYDPGADRMLFFGGESAAGALHDAWAVSFAPETVRNIESAVTTMIENVEFRGYRNLWLAIEGGSATPAEIDADRISCEAGLGGNTPEDEMAVFPEFLRKIRKRMAPWGVDIPMFDHPRMGKV